MSSWRTATFSSRPAIDTKFANDMASKETLEEVKNLLKQELSPINAKLDGLTTKLSDIDTVVNFLSGKFAFPKHIKRYLLSEQKQNQFSTSLL